MGHWLAAAVFAVLFGLFAYVAVAEIRGQRPWPALAWGVLAAMNGMAFVVYLFAVLLHAIP